jgi:aspartyl/asparaginyl-tRNA synthetase
MKLFGEARYVYIHTPAITEANGLGTTELIPVTFGMRW